MTRPDKNPSAKAVLPPQRRRDLLESAAAEFIAHGYQRASLNRIIAAQSMSKSSFYHYFENKEALFDALVTELAQALVTELDPPDPHTLGHDDFWEEIAAVMTRMIRLSGDESLAEVANLFYLPDAPQEGAVRDIRDAVDAWIAAALMAGRVCGAVRADLPVSLQNRLVMAVLWAMDEWSVAHLHQPPPVGTEPDRRRLVTTQLDIVRRMLDPGALPVGHRLGQCFQQADRTVIG